MRRSFCHKRDARTLTSPSTGCFNIFMGGPLNLRIAESYLDWWMLAGVDATVGETPANWLEAPPVNDNAPRRRMVSERVEELPPLPEILLKKNHDAQAKNRGPLVFPEEWHAFQNWLAAGDDVPGTGWDARRVLPMGEQNSETMIITAWPELDDQRAGRHFTGAMGVLVENMLQAVGLKLDQCYVASMASTRPAGGRCHADDLPELQRLLAHHIKLAQPQRIILMGHDISRIITGQDMPRLRGHMLKINQNGQDFAVIALPHPAMMLLRPAHKAAAWDSLKLIRQGTML